MNNRFPKQLVPILFSCVLLFQNTYAEEIKNLPTPPKLSRLIKGIDLDQSRTKLNQPQFTVKYSNGTSQEVFIQNEVYKIGGTIYYAVVATIYVGERRPSEAVLQAALNRNANRFVTLTLMDAKDPSFPGKRKYADSKMTFGEHKWGMQARLICSSETDSEGLKKVIMQVAEDAYVVKQKYFVGNKMDEELDEENSSGVNNRVNQELTDEGFKKSLVLDISIAEYFTKRAKFSMAPKEASGRFEDEFGKGVMIFSPQDEDTLIFYSTPMTRFRTITVRSLFPVEKANFLDLNEFMPVSGNKWLGKFKNITGENVKSSIEYKVTIDVLQTPEYNFDRLVSIREAIQTINEARVMALDKDGKMQELYEAVKKGLLEEGAIKKK